MTERNSLNVIKKEDFELYIFPVPFLKFKKNNRNYISRELEKLHPCYSDEDCFDYYYFFRKGKILAAIVVMEKYKLELYRKNSKKELVLEGSRRKVFSDNEKNKLLHACLFTTICIFLLIFIFEVGNLKNKNRDESKKEIEDEISDFENDEINIDELMKSLTDSKNCIASFDYENNTFNLDVENVDIQKLFNTEAYKCGALEIPEMIFSENKRVNLTYRNENMFSEKNSQDSMESVESNVLDEICKEVIKEGRILRENFSQGIISFEVSGKNLCKTFGNLGDEMEERNLNFQFIHLSKEENLFNIEVALIKKGESELCNNWLCRIFQKYEKLFFDPPETYSSIVKFSSLENGNNLRGNVKDELSDENEIGRISYGNGKTVIYYLLENGIIKSIEK